jgi:hypothetical protein
VRSRGYWIAGLEQRQLAADAVAGEIQLYDFGGVPQRDVGAPAVFRNLQGDGIGRGNSVAFGEIESVLDLAGRGVDEQNVVRQIVCNQQFLRTGRSDRGNRRGKGNPLVAGRILRQLRHAARPQLLHGQMHEALGRDLSIAEAVDYDAAAGVAFLGAGRIGERAHAGVDVRAVAAEGQARVERLLGGALGGALVGKIGECAGLRVEHRKRLVIIRLPGAIAVIHRDHVPAVRRDGHGNGQAVEALRMAGDGADQGLARRQIHSLRAQDSRRGKEYRAGSNQQKSCLHFVSRSAVNCRAQSPYHACVCTK